MKKLLLLILVMICNSHSDGQTLPPHIVDGDPRDSIIIRFDDSAAIAQYLLPDTGSLWQIGHSRKNFFGLDTTGPTVMITDSVNNYPINANNSFTIKINRGVNRIVDFWHRYQTDSGHDGGVVEFSIDTGITWQNIKGPCNVDSFWGYAGVCTDSFYSFNDTLLTGEPAFTGIKNYTQYSRLQFYSGLPIKSTESHGCHFYGSNPIYIRFRFISDTTADTLAGWMIDSIKIEQDIYWGAVVGADKYVPLPISPNPSADGQFNLPLLEDGNKYTIEVYNSLGQRILIAPYTKQLDISRHAPGLYLYRITGSQNYSGRLQYN